MVKPTLCKKHFFGVANYFDKQLAVEFEIDGENCLVCNKTMNVEMARWFVRQNTEGIDTRSKARPRNQF